MNHSIRKLGAAKRLALKIPPVPQYRFDMAELDRVARGFVSAFPGKTMFAVKCNPHPSVIRQLYKSGVKTFDCASLEEVRIVTKMAPKAEIYFMHPIKSREVIALNYFQYGIRTFVIDCKDEFFKIRQETRLASDLSLFVRLDLPKDKNAGLALDGKFGASLKDTVELLRMARPVAQKLGICFHVGSQAMEPTMYTKAINLVAKAIHEAGVTVDEIDVGGGFPVAYPEMSPPDLYSYMEAISDAIIANNLQGISLSAEPGRALVASCGTLRVRVEARKKNTLYLNDGTYGGLFDAGKQVNFTYPVNKVGDEQNEERVAYSLNGPTCDSIDMMSGPFWLPADMKEGDWIEFAQMGSYSYSMRTDFNGFGACAIEIANEIVSTRKKADVATHGLEDATLSV